MKGTTKGADVLEAVEEAVSSLGLDWEKLTAPTTDGAPAMVGVNNGFVGLLRKKLKNPDLPAIHCFTHQEALCAKSLKMPHVMSVVTRIVNYIRSHALNHRAFKTFLEMMGEDFTDIPYYTEVRWLSRAKVLFRFFKLRERVAEFLDSKGRPEPLLSDPLWISDLAFLVDVTG